MPTDRPSAVARVAIVVLNFNGLEDTLQCLESLRPLAASGHDVILVDNGSTIDPLAASAQVLPDLVYLRNEQNLGYAGGNNRGIALALERGAEFVLVLNNDTTVAPSLVDELVDVLARNPGLGVVGPLINFMDEPDVVMTDGVSFNPGPGTEFFKRIVVPPGQHPPALVPVDIVNGCCMMLRADVVRRVGRLDEHFFIVHEESDLCLKVLRAGFGCAVFGRTLVWHKGSSAFDRSGRQLQRYFDARNLWYLISRHTGRVGRSRGLLPSALHYIKYCYYRYDVERDAGKPVAGGAVVEGVYDALLGRGGPYVRRWRIAVPVLAALFAAVRRVGRRSPAEPHSGAPGR